MVFWFSIVIGSIFALIGMKKSLYPMWALLFNILVSIYLGVMLTPYIVDMVPGLQSSRYHHAGGLAVIAIGCFAIMHGFAVYYLTGTFSVSFPKIINLIGGGVWGFLSGYLAASFVFFVIYVMPFSRKPFMTKVFGPEDATPVAVKSVEKVCGLVNSLSLQCKNDPAKIIEWLLHGYELTYRLPEIIYAPEYVPAETNP